MTTRTLLPRVAVVLACLWPAPGFGQLPPPNDLGVRLGHIHLTVTDIDAHERFWVGAFGGRKVSNGPVSMIEFPGVYIMLQQGTPSGPPAGSIVDHFGFVLKDLAGARTRWTAAGVKFDVGRTNPNQGYVFGPDGVRVEVFGDLSLPGPLSMDHIHLYPAEADIPAIQAWYARTLGGLPGKRQRVSQPGLIDCDYFHRFNLSFSASDTRRVPTKGRSIDHLGFDVRNLDELVAKLGAQGITLDSPPRLLPNSTTRVATLTDPWGTHIELTENLAAEN
jgi:catechol-2,3-dioxygenase